MTKHLIQSGLSVALKKITIIILKKTRIVRESDYSPASQLFLQGEKKQ